MFKQQLPFDDVRLRNSTERIADTFWCFGKWISKFSITLLLLYSQGFLNVARADDAQTISYLKPSNESCDSAINGVKEYLIKNKYFVFDKNEPSSIKLDVNSMPEMFFDYPKDRQTILYFTLSGEVNRLNYVFLSSPQLMSNLTARIMSSCPEIGLVNYDYYHWGGVPVGYFPDGTARTFIYTTDLDSGKYTRIFNDDRGTTKFKWGYYFYP